MLFYFDNSLGDSVRNERLTDDEIAVVDLLAQSHRKEKNFIFGDRNIIADLAKSSQISRLSRAVFLTISGGYAYLLPQANLVKRRIVIANVPGVSVVNEGLRKNIVMPLLCLDNKSFINGVVVYFENRSDEDVYRAIVERVKTDRGMTRVGFSMCSRGGGGDTTASELQGSLRGGEISICVVDSDIKAPGRAVGATAKKILKTVAAGGELTALHIVNVHEVENLIPPEIYEINSAHPELMSIVSELRKIHADGRGDVYLYFDYKKGLRRCDVTSCQYMARYWGAISGCGKCDVPKQQPCYLIKPYGVQPNVREKIVADGMMPRTFVEELYDVWREIFDFLLDWCIASPKQLIV